MKQTIANIFTTTCVVQLVLICISIIDGRLAMDNLVEAAIPYFQFFQIFGINIVINAGLFFIGKLESKFVILEYLLDVFFISIILLVSSIIFDFFPYRRWLVLLIGLIVYIFGLLTDMVRTNKYAKEMNELIQKRNRIRAHSAS